MRSFSRNIWFKKISIDPEYPKANGTDTEVNRRVRFGDTILPLQAPMAFSKFSGPTIGSKTKPGT